MLVCVYCMICRQTRGLSTTVNYCQLCIYIYIIFTITGNLMTHQHCKPRWVLFMIFVLFFSFLCVLNYIQQLHPLLYVVVVVVAPEKKKKEQKRTGPHARPRMHHVGDTKANMKSPNLARKLVYSTYLPTQLCMYYTSIHIQFWSLFLSRNAHTLIQSSIYHMYTIQLSMLYGV